MPAAVSPCSPGVVGPHRWQCDDNWRPSVPGLTHETCTVCGWERDVPAIGELRRDFVPGRAKPRHSQETMPDFEPHTRSSNPLRTPVSAVTPYRMIYDSPPDSQTCDADISKRRIDVVPSDIVFPEAQTGLKQRKTKGEKTMAKSNRYATYEKHMAYEGRKAEIIAGYQQYDQFNKAAAHLGIPKSTLRGLLVRWGELRGLLVRWGEYVPKPLPSFEDKPEYIPLTPKTDWEKSPDVLGTPPPTAYLAALLERLQQQREAHQVMRDAISLDIIAVERVMARGGMDEANADQHPV